MSLMSPYELKMRLDLAEDKLAFVKSCNMITLCSPTDPMYYGILTTDGEMHFFDKHAEEAAPPRAMMLWLPDRLSMDFPLQVPRCKTISHSCYADCTALPGICIPDTVEEICTAAFSNCSSLKEVCIPDSVKHTGSAVFRCCTSLKKISFSASLTCIGHVICKDCISLEEAELRGSPSEIGADAFMNCFSLKSISIPEGVRWIDRRAFYNCRSLKHVSLPSTLEIVDPHAFFGCTALEEIEIPAGIKDISGDAFAECWSLKKVLFKGKSLNDVMASRHCPFGAHPFAIAGEKDIDFRALDARSSARKRR